MIGSDGKRTNARSDRSLTNVNQIDLKVHALVKPLVPMKNGRCHKSVYCKGAVYVFTDDRRDDNLAVEKYCLQANTWTHVSDKFDYRTEMNYRILRVRRDRQNLCGRVCKLFSESKSTC